MIGLVLKASHQAQQHHGREIGLHQQRNDQGNQRRSDTAAPRLLQVDLKGSGVCHCHGATHQPLEGLSRAATDAEVGESRAALEDRIGRSVDLFAAPFGSTTADATAVARLGALRDELGAQGIRLVYARLKRIAGRNFAEAWLAPRRAQLAPDRFPTLRSAVRAQIHGDAPPSYAGYTAWRGVAAMEDRKSVV